MDLKIQIARKSQKKKKRQVKFLGGNWLNILQVKEFWAIFLTGATKIKTVQ